jgi:CHAD domain-containing protein
MAMAKKSIEPTDPPSLSYADAWMEKLQKQLPETVKSWDADAIHQSRVATRRLAAALGVLEPVLSKEHRKPLAKTLRKLRRQLGPLRDLDVMLDHLTGFRPTPGIEWLRHHLGAERDDRRRHAADRLHPTRALAKLGAWWAVRQEWAEAGDGVDGLLSNAVHLQLDALADRAADTAGDPHELRIAAKALRYTLELAVESGHKLPASVARSFKRMQDALGAWHDMVVLADAALDAAVDTGLAYHDADLHLAVVDVARSAVRRSVRHMGAFKEMWRSRGATLTDTIRSRFPIVVVDPESPVSESQTDPDPLGSAGTPDPAPPAPADPAAG